MATMCRAGTGLLLAWGLGLAVLMVYILTPEGGLSVVFPAQSGSVSDVAVFYPERVDWLDFRSGIANCAKHGLVQDVEFADDVVTLKTTEGHSVRFSWYGVRDYSSEAKERVRELVGSRNLRSRSSARPTRG